MVTTLERSARCSALEHTFSLATNCDKLSEEGITLLCGRNCQALLSAFSSFLYLCHSSPADYGRSHAHTGSVREWAACWLHSSYACLRLLWLSPSPRAAGLCMDGVLLAS